MPIKNELQYNWITLLYTWNIVNQLQWKKEKRKREKIYKDNFQQYSNYLYLGKEYTGMTNLVKKMSYSKGTSKIGTFHSNQCAI